MSWFWRRKKEKRFSGDGKSISDPGFWPNLFGRFFGFESKTGITVNPDTALCASAVFACVRVLAESVGSLPLMVFKRDEDGGKSPAPDHPLYYLLHDSPNNFQTSYDYRTMKMGHTSLRGNAYSKINRVSSGEIAGLVPLHPAYMTPKAVNGDIIYEYRKPDGGETVTFKSNEIWHWKGLSSDGLVGLSTISQMRDPIGIALGSDAYSARFFQNNGRPSGFITFPGKFTDDQKKQFREKWNKEYAGQENYHKFGFLDQGLDWKQVGLSMEDAQLIEQRRFQIEEIARAFRVPCILIGHPDKTATYASAEQFMLSFVIHTLRPWLVNIEQSANKYLLTDEDRAQGYFVEHKIEGLLRGAFADQMKGFVLAVGSRIMSPNECRALLNMNPYPGGDSYENPNITPGATGADDQNQDQGDKK